MIVLVCATLLFCAGRSDADAGGSVWGRTVCQNYYPFCVTLTEVIRAEAGLCAVIPCSFTTPDYFKPQHVVWYKCEPSGRCGDSQVIFHSNKNSRKPQAGFAERVSLLEPDVGRNNCSVLVSDLSESDSGSYQVRVNGLISERSDGFTFSPRTAVSVTGLTQTPTVTVPPLTAGQQSTLTCTAPGLCSGSAPGITWTWRRAGGENGHFAGNVTAFNTEKLTAVTERHSSTLTFAPSAEHHGTEVTCKVSFTGDVTTEETVTLNVTYVREIQITGATSVKEGEALSLTCSVDSFPPSLLTWSKLSERNATETDPQMGPLADLQNVTESDLEESGVATLSIANVSAEDSGQYVCTAQHLNNWLQKRVNLTVTYIRAPEITGSTTVKEGDALNLTCSVDGFPPPLITWTRRGFDGRLAISASSSLFIPKVAQDQSGQYTCTAQHLDTALPAHANVTVVRLPKILESRCEVRAEVLTCVCVSYGPPLPTVRWPLLENRTEYSVVTAVSNGTVNSMVTLAAEHGANASVECVASSANGEARENLGIHTHWPPQQDKGDMLHRIVSQLETIVGFLIGVLLSAVFCCVATNCRRKRQRSSGNLDETLQMVSSQEGLLIYDDPAVEEDQFHVREGVEDGAVAVEKTAPEQDGAHNDVEYASINFSLLKRRNPRLARKRESTETEYAEIKKGVREEREEAEGDTLEGNKEEEEEEEEAAEIGEDEEAQPCITQQEEEAADVGEDEEAQPCVPEQEEEALYSTVYDIMGDM